MLKFFLFIISIPLFAENFYLIQKVIGFNNFRYGLINKNGSLVLNKDYDAIGSVYENVVWVRKNSKWGLIKLNGKKVLDFQFDDVRELEGGISVVVKPCYRFVVFSCENGKFGLIDITGKILLEPTYSNFLGIENYTNKTLFNKVNGVLLTEEKFISEDGYLRPINESMGLFKNRKIGLVSREGKEILPTEYKNLGIVQAGKISFLKSIDFKGLSSGILDLNGNLISKREYISVEDLTKNSENPVYFAMYRENKKNKQVFLNSSLDEIEIDSVRKIFPFTNETKSWVKNLISKNSFKSKINQIDKNGIINEEIEFDRIEYLDNEFAVLNKENKKYLYDPNLNQVFETEKEIFFGNEKILILQEKNKKYKIYFFDETEISNLEFDSVRKIKQDFSLEIGQSKGILSRDGSFFFKEGFEIIYKDSENFYWFKKENREFNMVKSIYGYFKEGKDFFVESHEPSEFHFGLSWVSKYGTKKNNSHILYKVLIDGKGKELTERKFLYTKEFDGNFAVGQIFGGNWCYIDKKGKEVYWSR